jgi:hypothetical protein
MKGDRVEWGHHAHLILLNFLGLLFRSLYLHHSLMAATDQASDTLDLSFYWHGCSPEKLLSLLVTIYPSSPPVYFHVSAIV